MLKRVDSRKTSKSNKTETKNKNKKSTPQPISSHDVIRHPQVFFSTSRKKYSGIIILLRFLIERKKKCLL